MNKQTIFMAFVLLSLFSTQTFFAAERSCERFFCQIPTGDYCTGICITATCCFIAYNPPCATIGAACCATGAAATFCIQRLPSQQTMEDNPTPPTSHIRRYSRDAIAGVENPTTLQ